MLVILHPVQTVLAIKHESLLSQAQSYECGRGISLKYLHRSQTQTEVNYSIKWPRQLSLTMNFQASPSWRPASSWQIDWVALEKVQVTNNQLLAPDCAQRKVCSTVSSVQKCDLFCNFVFRRLGPQMDPL